MRSSDPKVGKMVDARTARGTEYVRGKVIAVDATAHGTWYTIQAKGGKPFKTRRACIK